MAQRMRQLLRSFLVIALAISAQTPAYSADQPSVLFSNVTIDKTTLSVGQSLKVTFDLSITGLTTGVPPSVSLVLSDLSSECEEECGTSNTKLVSGTTLKGSWSSSVTLGNGNPSGTYKVLINIPKLKGVPSAIYYDPQQISYVAPSSSKSSTTTPTIAFSNVVVDKTALSTGQSLKVTFDMTSTGLSAGLQPLANISMVDMSNECEEECGVSSTTLSSGTLAKGSWIATITPGSGLPSGLYRVFITIPKLKGVKGALFYDSKQITLTNISPSKAPVLAPTLTFSNVVVDRNTLLIGETLRVTFNLESSGIPNGMTPSASITSVDQSIECEEECGSGTVSLTSGSIAKGSWLAVITPGKGILSGTYKVMLAFPKLKGVKNAFYVDSKAIVVTNTGITQPSAPGKINSKSMTKITCIKGKSVRTVQGAKPKCPAGYTQR